MKRQELIRMLKAAVYDLEYDVPVEIIVKELRDGLRIKAEKKK